MILYLNLYFQTIQDVVDGHDEMVMKAIQEGINLGTVSHRISIITNFWSQVY